MDSVRSLQNMADPLTKGLARNLVIKSLNSPRDGVKVHIQNLLW